MAGRDMQLERRLLGHLVGVAHRRFGVDCRSYLPAVERRLAMGQERYGDSFLERPGDELLAEVLEEAEDLAGWSLLSLQRITGAHPDVRDDLLRVVLLGAVADHYARRAQQRLRDGGRQ